MKKYLLAFVLFASAAVVYAQISSDSIIVTKELKGKNIKVPPAPPAPPAPPEPGIHPAPPPPPVPPVPSGINKIAAPLLPPAAPAPPPPPRIIVRV